jgi:hypothetical protein
MADPNDDGKTSVFYACSACGVRREVRIPARTKDDVPETITRWVEGIVMLIVGMDHSFRSITCTHGKVDLAMPCPEGVTFIGGACPPGQKIPDSVFGVKGKKL